MIKTIKTNLVVVNLLLAALTPMILSAAGPANGQPTPVMAGLPNLVNPIPSELWGRIANKDQAGKRVIGSIFFAGPLNPLYMPFQTRHPLSDKLYGWTKEDADFALTQMTTVGLNTVFFSYWGHDGETDKWSPSLLFSLARWPGDPGTNQYTESEQVAKARDFFALARAHGLLLAPFIEVSKSNEFSSCFPNNITNLVSRCEWLLRNLGKEPNWLEMYDQTGNPRFAIRLVETIHISPIDPQSFADGFTKAAAQILKDTGYHVGFLIDPTPLPAYGPDYGPDPAALRNCPVILAIDPFNIDCQALGAPRKQALIPESQRLDYQESVLRKWHDSGMPLIAPIMPGYDAHMIFPDAGVYGFNAKWRRQQKDLALHYATAGVSIDCWNGWEEGYEIPPSVEDNDEEMLWATDVMKSMRAKWEAMEQQSSRKPSQPFFPASGPATGLFNGLHPKSKFLATNQPS